MVEIGRLGGGRLLRMVPGYVSVEALTGRAQENQSTPAKIVRTVF